MSNIKFKAFRSRYVFTRSILIAIATLGLVFAASAQSKADTLIFAVNEGVTYKTGGDASKQNYNAIADDLARLLKTKVRVDMVGEYATLEKDLAAKTYGIAFIHPTHIAIAPVKLGTYTLAAVSKAHIDYKASFLSKIKAQPKSPEELGKLLGSGTKMIGSPDSNSITAWLIRATVRDAAAAAKVAAPQLKFTRYQESIPFMVSNGFVDIAATASETIVKEWVAAGGNVITMSKSVPIKNIIVSNALSKESIDLIKTYFLELSANAGGQAKLERIGLKQGFVAYDQTAFVALGTWLGL